MNKFMTPHLVVRDSRDGANPQSGDFAHWQVAQHAQELRDLGAVLKLRSASAAAPAYRSLASPPTLLGTMPLSLTLTLPRTFLRSCSENAVRSQLAHLLEGHLLQLPHAGHAPARQSGRLRSANVRQLAQLAGRSRYTLSVHQNMKLLEN